MAHLSEASRQLRSLAVLTEFLCSLPAYPSAGWCGLAAERLLGLEEDLIACVTIGWLESTGLIVRREAAGVAASGVSDERTERLRADLLHGGPSAPSLGDPTGWDGPRVCGRRRGMDTSSLSGSATDLGLGEELVGGAWLDADNPRRIVFVELSLIGHERVWSDSRVELLTALLEPLSRRAAMAFGVGEGPGAAQLTRREEEVLVELALGKSVREIAIELKRSPHTVHDHVKSLHRKLRASSRGELIARALGHLHSI